MLLHQDKLLGITPRRHLPHRKKSCQDRVKDRDVAVPRTFSSEGRRCGWVGVGVGGCALGRDGEGHRRNRMRLFMDLCTVITTTVSSFCSMDRMHLFMDLCKVLTTMISFSSSMKEKFMSEVCGGSSPSWQLRFRV
jgi:hypothetical protein